MLIVPMTRLMNKKEALNPKLFVAIPGHTYTHGQRPILTCCMSPTANGNQRS